MPDRTIETLRAKLAQLRKRAAERRDVSRVDAVADAIDFCVGELAETLDRLDEETTYLTPAEFARAQKPPRDVQTVRRWIREGRLEAIAGSSGYLIHRDAKVRPFQRAG